jgi:hypothetical protein
LNTAKQSSANYLVFFVCDGDIKTFIISKWSVIIFPAPNDVTRCDNFCQFYGNTIFLEIFEEDHNEGKGQDEPQIVGKVQSPTIYICCPQSRG